MACGKKQRVEANNSAKRFMGLPSRTSRGRRGSRLVHSDLQRNVRRVTHTSVWASSGAFATLLFRAVDALHQGNASGDREPTMTSRLQAVCGAVMGLRRHV